jgi:hypothetical protein
VPPEKPSAPQSVYGFHIGIVFYVLSLYNLQKFQSLKDVAPDWVISRLLEFKHVLSRTSRHQQHAWRQSPSMINEPVKYINYGAICGVACSPMTRLGAKPHRTLLIQGACRGLAPSY